MRSSDICHYGFNSISSIPVTHPLQSEGASHVGHYPGLFTGTPDEFSLPLEASQDNTGRFDMWPFDGHIIGQLPSYAPIPEEDDRFLELLKSLCEN